MQRAYGTSLQQNYATYTYSPNGQRTSVTDANGNRAEMRYDDYDRQVRWVFPHPTATGSVNEADYEGYGYDAIGNVTSDGSTSFDYDDNGNLTLSSDPGGSISFVYDAENRLVSASGGRNATLAYDPLGRLWQVTAPSGTTRFLYDGDALVAEYDGAGNMLRRYVHGPGTDEPVAVYQGASIGFAARNYLMEDERGSIIALVNANGSIAAVNAYDAWGIPNATNQGRFGYTGQAWIPELGLYYYKARFYSPTLGRFLQTDPVGYADQVNLYAYVGNDPINSSDPSGMRETCDARGCTITADGFDRSRSNEQTTTLNEAQAEQAVADRGSFRATGDDEVTGFGFGTARGETRTEVSTDATTSRGAPIPDGHHQVTTADIARAQIPPGATWAQHGHVEGSREGMADNTRVGGGYGDSQPLTQRLPSVVVSERRVGVREIVGGRLQHRMLHGSLTGPEKRAIQRNLNSEQRLFYRNP